jgi:hypothetical protein
MVHLLMTLRDVTAVIVAIAQLGHQAPRLGLVVRVPALVVPLQRPELGQLVPIEPLPDARRLARLATYPISGESQEWQATPALVRLAAPV